MRAADARDGGAGVTTGCPHGGPHSKPEMCSQCLGAIPKRVEQAGPEMFIDGEPIRTIAPDVEPNAHQPRQQRRNRGRK